MEKQIGIIRGDGIGPEIVEAALGVLGAVSKKFGHAFAWRAVEAGGCAIDRYGDPLPEESLMACLQCDSVLLGAVGGPKWDACPKEIRPERALLRLRSALGLYANLRPSRLFPQLASASPLKDEIVKRGIDLLLVRELTGGIYFGKRETRVVDGEKVAEDRLTYTEHEIERIARVAFDAAMKRRRKLTSVDKANVLDSSRLWREVVTRVSLDYPDVSYSDMLVDNAAMQLVRDPSQFDVIVTENMFGDILSDEASMITGSIGMIPSSSQGVGTRGLYEPIHGSAPDIAGKDLANPIGTILSAAMMLKYSFNMLAESEAVEAAVERTLKQGFRTGDILQPGMTPVSCSQMGRLVADCI